MRSLSALFAFSLFFVSVVAGAEEPAAAIHAHFAAHANATHRVHCLELEGVRIDDLRVSGDSATARVTTAMTKRERATSRVRQSVLTVHSVALTRQNGGWRVRDASPAVEKFADELLAAADPQELLARNPELMSEDLVRALIRRAHAFVLVPKLRDAARAGALAEALASDIGDAGGVAMSLSVRSAVAQAEGRREEARAYGSEAVALARQANDADALVRGLTAVARTYDNEVGSEVRPRLLHEAVALEDRVDDLTAIARAYAALKTQEWQTDNWVAMRRWIDEEIRVSSLANYPAGVTNGHLTLSAMSASLGDPETCLQYALRSAESVAERPSGPYLNAKLLESLCRRLRGEHDGLRELAEQNLKSARELDGMWLMETYALGELASVDFLDGDYEAAERHTRESLAVLEAHEHPGDAHYVFLARIHLARGRYAEALEATRMFRASGASRAHTVLSKTFDAIAQRALGNTCAALEDLDVAMAASEDLHSRLFGDERQRATALRSAADPFLEAVDLNVELGRFDAALASAERGRGRILLERVGKRPPRPGTSMTAEERETGLRLENELAALNRDLLAASDRGAATDAIRERLSHTRTDYETFRAALYVRHPELKTRSGAVPVASLEKMLASLPERGAFLEYVVGEKRTHLFVVSDAGVRVHVLPIGREALEAKVTAYRMQLARRALAQRSGARGLDELLLAPVEDVLRTKRVLGIVADGVLWQVPFEALVDARGRYRVETHTIFYAPSISIFLEMRGATRRSVDRTRPTLLAVGDPLVSDVMKRNLHAIYRSADLSPLPDAQTEVEELRSIYGGDASKVYVGAAATESRVKAEIERRHIVHFATHGILDDTNPMYSRLVLAQAKDATGSDADGLLEAWELMDLDLEADLVVLSSCDGARGVHSAGEGMIGMTWAAFVAGAQTTVASLWKVTSKSTSTLMVDFHRELQAHPEGEVAKAEALRRAKLRMLRSKGREHPFYWAAFVAIGDPE